jgi:DGQHR domain-containing protein
MSEESQMITTHASEGRQGKHRFFTTSMRWGELDHALVFHDELGDLDEDQRMQRGLARNRLDDLRQYLTTVDDHFFSALTLVILPRSLDRGAVEGTSAEDESDWDYLFERDEKRRPGLQKTGTLHLSGDVRLFPADGQHRAMAGRTAIRDNPELAKEEVPVVLVPYDTADQVRQLFSDLNLNAKPVSRTTGLDFDTRQPVALLAKAVGAEVPLFVGRVNRVSNSLPKSSVNVITLNTLAQGTEAILKAIVKETHPDVEAADLDAVIRDFVRVHEGSIDRLAVQEVSSVWEVIVDVFALQWKRVLDGEHDAAGEIRDEFLFPHGLGWLALAQAAADLMLTYGEEWEDRFRTAVGSFDWRREAEVWTGMAVIYDPEKDSYRVNNTGPAVRAVAKTIVSAAK